MGKDGHLCDNTTFRWYSLASCSTTGAGFGRHRAEHRTSSRYYYRNRILGKMCKSLLLDLSCTWKILGRVGRKEGKEAKCSLTGCKGKVSKRKLSLCIQHRFLTWFAHRQNMSHVHFEQKYFLKANKQQSHTKFLINTKSIINWKSAFFRRS